MLKRAYNLHYAGISGQYVLTEKQVKDFFTLERRYVDSKSAEQLLLLAFLERACLDGLAIDDTVSYETKSEAKKA